jgi:quercetin dioxygenase-like cupin family protein
VVCQQTGRVPSVLVRGVGGDRGAPLPRHAAPLHRAEVLVESGSVAHTRNCASAGQAVGTPRINRRPPGVSA